MDALRGVKTNTSSSAKSKPAATTAAARPRTPSKLRAPKAQGLSKRQPEIEDVSGADPFICMRLADLVRQHKWGNVKCASSLSIVEVLGLSDLAMILLDCASWT